MHQVLLTRVCFVLLIICGATKVLSVKNESVFDGLQGMHSCSNNFYQCSQHSGYNNAIEIKKDLTDDSIISYLIFASAKSFLLIIALASVMGVVIISTFYDVRTRRKGERNQLLLSFSLYTNASSLMNMDQTRPPDAINCLHGIRAISILSIIFFHGYFYKTFSPFGKSPEISAWMETRYASTISAMNVFVDSYFVMSAALTTRSMLKDLESRKFNYFKTVFQRYMRLTPSVGAMILFNRFLAFYLYPNPSSEFMNYSVIPCEKNWWFALLHLQVYTNPREMCMHTTWYLSVEWQMMIFVAPVLVYLLWKLGQAYILPLIKMLIVLSCLYGFKVSYGNGFNAKELNLASNLYEAFYDEFYYPTHIRGAPFLVGIILGYHLHARCPRTTTERKHLLTFMWILSYTTIFGPTFISVIYDIIGENLFMNSLLVSTIRSIWAISIAWIIFMCQTGEFKLMNKLLSSRYWMPIGKLGFTLYLVHPVLQYNFTASQDQNTNFELPRMFDGFIKDLLMSGVFSICLFFFVEEPFSLVAKYLAKDWNVKKKPKQIVEKK